MDLAAFRRNTPVCRCDGTALDVDGAIGHFGVDLDGLVSGSRAGHRAAMDINRAAGHIWICIGSGVFIDHNGGSVRFDFAAV